MFDLTGKTAFITGASRGIGQAVTLMLARLGAQVVGTATTPEGAEAICNYLQAQGLSGQGVVLDVTHSDAIEKLFLQVAPPDILVNNAGVTRDNLLLRMKDEEWDAVIATNLTAIYRLSKACIKYMLKTRWGRIISISSVSGVMGNAGQTNYAAAKAGIIGFSKALAAEVASRQITVNVIAPGFIDTDMTRTLTDTQRESLFAHIPCQRFGRPEEIAAAVAFLASPAAGYITGETIQINGGMYMQ